MGARARDDDDVLDARRFAQRIVGHLLERHDRPAPVAAIGGDEQARLRVVDAIAQRLGGEAAKDDGVHRADARAGQHRDRQLGDERHVERHAVALADAEPLEDVGELADLAVELEVGQRAAIAGLALPDEGRLVAAPGADMAVEAIGADVQLAADEPLRVRRIPLEHLRPGLNPLELLGEVLPERFRVRRRPGVDLRIRDMAPSRGTRLSARRSGPPAAGRRFRT